MAMQKATIGTVAAIAIMSVIASAIGGLFVTQTVHNAGNINVVTSPPPPPATVQLGVYQDSGCTAPLKSISWGSLNPGSSTNSTMYLRNEGNVAVTLSLQVGNWTPSTAQNYLTLTWNRDGYVLQPNAVVQAVLTLTVSSSITGITSFNFDITITASQ